VEELDNVFYTEEDESDDEDNDSSYKNIFDNFSEDELSAASVKGVVDGIRCIAKVYYACNVKFDLCGAWVTDFTLHLIKFANYVTVHQLKPTTT
jgi:hypothetical protein